MKPKKSSNLFDIVVYIMMILAVVFIVFATLSGYNDNVWYKLSLGVWMLLTVIISDFVDPIVSHRFQGMKSLKVQTYIMYAIADAAAIACLYLFVINVNLYKEPFHYMFLAVAVILYIMKNAMFSKYDSISEGARSAVMERKYEKSKEDTEVSTIKYRKR